MGHFSRSIAAIQSCQCCTLQIRLSRNGRQEDQTSLNHIHSSIGFFNFRIQRPIALPTIVQGHHTCSNGGGAIFSHVMLLQLFIDSRLIFVCWYYEKKGGPQHEKKQRIDIWMILAQFSFYGKERTHQPCHKTVYYEATVGVRLPSIALPILPFSSPSYKSLAHLEVASAPSLCQPTEDDVIGSVPSM